MSTDGPVDVAAASPARLVVWWRRPAVVQVPRVHEVGWSTVDGGASGRFQIHNPHQRIPPEVVVAHLHGELRDRLPGPVQVRPFSEMESEVSTQVRLQAAGHTVTDVDLMGCYGLDVIVGVSAELTGRGARAVVTLERTLMGAVREAAARWAQAEIDVFARADPQTLRDGGWQQMTSSRWQILGRQPG